MVRIINASLKNAKGMLFCFRDNGTQTQGGYALSNRTSLGMLQAQLSIDNYTFPANRYLLYDCSTSLATVAAADIDNICAPVLLFWEFDPLPSA